jgi:hypothetical protein
MDKASPTQRRYRRSRRPALLALAALLAGCISPPPASTDGGCVDCDTARSDADNVPISNVTHRKRITVLAEHVTGTHVDFPAFFSKTDPAIDGLVSDVNQLRFTDEDGEPIPFAIDSLDLETGAISAWLRLPRVTDRSDTDFYLEILKQPSPPDTAPEDVWRDYTAVYHLSEEVSDGTTIDDASPNANDGTASNTSATATIPDGVAGAAVQFDGVDDRIEIPDRRSFETPMRFTISAWVRVKDIVGTANVISKPARSVAGADYDSWQIYLDGDETMHSSSFHGTVHEFATATLTTGTWTHLALVFDGERLVHYIDGNPVGMQSEERPVDFDDDPVLIGAELDGETYVSFLAGAVDEIRITARARTDGWLATQVENLAHPNQFFGFGPLESVR